MGQIPFPRLVFRYRLKRFLDVLVVGIMIQIVVPYHPKQAFLVERLLELGVRLLALLMYVGKIDCDKVLPVLEIDASLGEHGDQEAQDDLRLRSARVFLDVILWVAIARESNQLNKD